MPVDLIELSARVHSGRLLEPSEVALRSPALWWSVHELLGNPNEQLAALVEVPCWVRALAELAAVGRRP